MAGWSLTLVVGRARRFGFLAVGSEDRQRVHGHRDHGDAGSLIAGVRRALDLREETDQLRDASVDYGTLLSR